MRNPARKTDLFGAPTRSRFRAHRSISAVATGAVAVALFATGCAAQEADPKSADTPQQSQEKLLGLLDETQALIGGEWENRDSGSPRDCELPGSGDKGTTFTGTRSLERAALDDDEISEVLQFWEDEGFEAGSGGMGVLTSVLAVNPDNKTYYIELAVGEHATQISGQAACVPGDTLTELERVKSGG